MTTTKIPSSPLTSATVVVEQIISGASVPVRTWTELPYVYESWEFNPGDGVGADEVVAVVDQLHPEMSFASLLDAVSLTCVDGVLWWNDGVGHVEFGDHMLVNSIVMQKVHNVQCLMINHMCLHSPNQRQLLQ